MQAALGALDFCPPIAHSAPVSQRPPLVGRARELDDLKQILARSAHGAGQLVLLAGEAGMGKSRLCEELATLAAEDERLVLWGRCWESGGAPAFWPWRQVLRSLARALGSAEPWAHDAVLSAFMGGSSLRPAGSELAGLDPEQARFALLEAIAQTLCDAARTTPLLIVLEDLHVADSASTWLLEFLETQLRHDPIMLLGTFRPSQLETTQLTGVVQRAHVVSLPALGAEAIERYLNARVNAPLAPGTLQDVVEATEGNPLFLEQVAQVIAHEPNAPRGALLTLGIKNIISERLSIHPEPDLEQLRATTVLGREFSLADAALLLGETETQVESLLERLTAGGAIERVGLRDYRFSHILVLETLYHALPVERRTALHLERARALRDKCEAGASSAWSAVAHHYLAAGELEQGIVALEAAARTALSQLAFDDAVELVERALAGLSQDVSPERRAELLLLLANARLQAGHITSGRAACHEAAHVARQIHSASLLARAALCCGSVFVFAKVDRRLVGLLQDALAALPPDAASERAEVSARLAAALQPSPTPEVPITLARDAIALARRQDDAPLLLRVMRSAISALMDMGPADERLVLNREYRALATRLGATSDLWRAHCRLLFDHFDLGQLDEAYDALSDVVAMADRLDQPDYAWRATAMRAMAAMFRGRLTEAERLWREAEPLGERARDPNWRRARAMARLVWYRTAGQRAPEQLIDDIATQFDGEIFGRLSVLGEWARAGRISEVRGAFEPADAQTIYVSNDTGVLQELAYVAVALDDPKLMRGTYEHALPHAERFVSGGMTSLTWEPPLHRALGHLALALGERATAVRHLERALTLVEGVGSRGFAAWIQLELAEVLMSPGASANDHEKAVTLLDAALANAKSVSLVRLQDLISAARERSSGETSGSASVRSLSHGDKAPNVRLEPDGELWCLLYDGARHSLANTKGVRLLARLLAEPCREFHVLDLESNSAGADLGHAGELLDPEAKRQYQQRLAELREQLDEAESWNDPARKSALQAELDELTRELSRAFGFGGRARTAASAAERARINVQRRLKDALRRVRAVAPLAARELERSVRTGTFCVYDP